MATTRSATTAVSVWPARYGHRGRWPGPVRVRRRGPEAIFGLFDAAEAQGGRLPSCSVGLDRAELVGARGLSHVVLTAGLGGGIAARVPADPAPAGSVDPVREDLAVPEPARGIGYLKVEGDPLAGSRVTIEVGSEVPGGWSVSGLPPRDRAGREPAWLSTAV